MKDKQRAFLAEHLNSLVFRQKIVQNEIDNEKRNIRPDNRYLALLHSQWGTLEVAIREAVEAIALLTKEMTD